MIAILSIAARCLFKVFLISAIYQGATVGLMCEECDSKTVAEANIEAYDPIKLVQIQHNICSLTIQRR